MLKQHIAVCLMATALVAAPAIAQTDTQPATPPAAGDTMQPRPVEPGTAQQTEGEAQTEMAAQDAAGHDLHLEGSFIARQSANHTLANDLIGVRVIGVDDSSIGSVKDLVMDGENRLVGIVVGVGGFLGIGEKDVAIPMDELALVPDVDATAAVGTGEATAREIDEVRVRMTREQLDEAPEFARLERAAPVMDPPATAPGAAPGGMAPAQPN